jgi:signal transduction histidine kinase
VRTELVVTGSDRLLPSETEIALLRTVQEALANVRKHAQANRVSVTLSFMDDEVILDVQDDGRGFVAARVPSNRDRHVSNGFGIPSMRRRVENLGGTLTVESAPGEGTTLMVSIPLLAAHEGVP